MYTREVVFDLSTREQPSIEHSTRVLVRVFRGQRLEGSARRSNRLKSAALCRRGAATCCSLPLPPALIDYLTILELSYAYEDDMKRLECFS